MRHYVQVTIDAGGPVQAPTQPVEAPPRDPSAVALADYRGRMRRQTRIYIAVLALITVAIVVLVQVVMRTGEIGNATLRPATSTLPAPAGTTTSTTLAQAWHSNDATATGVPYDTGTVVTYDSHTVTGRNYATGAAIWTYTRSDVTTCNVFQEFGITFAIFTDRDGFCDEADAFDTSTGARKWERTLDSNGNTVNGPVVMTATQYTLMIVAPKYIQAVDPVSAIDRWTFIDPPGCTNTSAVQGSVGVLISQHCGNGNHLILRDAYTSDDNDNKAKADWNVLSDAIPVSADGLITALDPTTGQLMVYSSTDGTAQDSQILTPLPVTTPAPTITNAVTSVGEVVTINSTSYGLATTTGAQLWTLAGAGRLTTQNADPLVINAQGITEIDPSTGRPLTSFAISTPPGGSVAYRLGTGFVVAGSSTTVYR